MNNKKIKYLIFITSTLLLVGAFSVVFGATGETDVYKNFNFNATSSIINIQGITLSTSTEDLHSTPTMGAIIFPDGTIQTTAAGGGNETISAGNISAGEFGSSTGGGNYSFAGNLYSNNQLVVSPYSVEKQLVYRSHVTENSRHEIRIPWPSTIAGPIILDVEVLIDTSSVGTRHYVKRRFYLTSYHTLEAGDLYSQSSYLVESIEGSSTEYNYINPTFTEDTVNDRITLSIYSGPSNNRYNSIKLTAWGTEEIVNLILDATYAGNVETGITPPGRAPVEIAPNDNLIINNKLAIGTTTPSYKLDVVGTGRFTQPVIVGTPTDETHATTKSYVDSVVSGGSSDASYNTLSVSGTTTLATTNGRVGIGTIEPSQELDIVGDINLEDTTSNDTGVIYKDGVRFIHNFNYGDNGTVTTDGYNTFIGKNAGNFTMGSTATETYHSSYNTALGRYSLYSNTTGYRNTAVGYTSLYSNITGYQNTALGYYSLRNNTTGYQNTALGNHAGRYIADGSTANETSNNSIYLGYNTKALADGDSNEIVIGYNATGIGSNSVVLGNDSITTTALKGNVGIGTESPSGKFHLASEGYSDIFVLERTNPSYYSKWEIGLANGNFNIGEYPVSTAANRNFIIDSKTKSVSMGYLQSESGWGVPDYSLLVAGNVGIGTTTPSGRLDVASGRISNVGTPVNNTDAATKNYVDSAVTGGSSDASYNTLTVSGTTTLATTGGNVGIGTITPSQELDIVGDINLEDTTSNDTGVIYKDGVRFIHNFQHPTGDTAVPAGYNTFVGKYAGNFTMGSTATQTWHSSYNTALGYASLPNNTTGYNNTALGYASLNNNTTGYNNTALGSFSLNSNTTGNRNTALGYASLPNNTTGYRNTALGYYAGRYIADGSTANETSNNSTYLGYNTKALADGDSNEIVIGYDATGIGSNSVVLGNDSITTTALKGNVGIGDTSPSYKLDVAGTGRFTQPVIVGTPTDDTHATTKSYVDSAASSGGQWTDAGSYIYANNNSDVVIEDSGSVGIGGNLNMNNNLIQNVFLATPAYGNGDAGVLIPGIGDTLFYAMERGINVTVNRNPDSGSLEDMFTLARGDHASWNNVSDINPVIITIDYNTQHEWQQFKNIALSFGGRNSEGIDFTLEGYNIYQDANEWVTLATITNNSDYDKIIASDTINHLKKLRFNFTDAGSSDHVGNLSISTIYATKQTDKGGGVGHFYTKGGGDVYGNINLNGNYLSGDGGNEGIYVDESGNVGVATTTPQGKLHVTGGGVLMSNNDGTYRVPVADTELTPKRYVDDNFAPITGGEGDDTGSAFVQGGNSFVETAVLGTNDNYNLNIETNNTTRMTIDTSGRVGIGTVSPAHPLTISDSGYNKLRLTRTEQAYGDWTFDIAGTSGDLYLTDQGGGSSDLILNLDNYVGIGESSPTSELDVDGEISASMYYDKDNTSYYIDPAGNLMSYSAYLNGKVGVNVGGGDEVGITTNGYIMDVSGNASGNYVPSHSWTIGTGSVGIFTRNGDTSENSREWGVGPHGNRAILWKATPDAADGADGGWNTDYFDIDHTKMYRFSVWIKKTGSTDGTTYLGTRGQPSPLTSLGGTENSNPYFFSADLPELDKWYLVVGYVHGSGDTSTTNYGAVYDGETGKRITGITDFKFQTGTLETAHRSYLYYSTLQNCNQYWWDPRVEEVNGSEPSIETLLGSPKSATVDNNAYFGGNVSIGTTTFSNTLTVDGNLLVTGSILGDENDEITGTLSAANVSAGAFGSNTGGGNYSFPGNIGIGTSTPSEKLEVDGQIYSTGQIRVGGLTDNDDSHYQWDGATYRSPGDFTPGVLVRQDNSDTGINSFKPALTLYNHIGSLSSTVGLVFASREETSDGNSVDLSGIMGVKESSGTANSWSDGGMAFFVKSDSTRVDAMYIDHTGNVGIGTSTPSSALEVVGTITADTFDGTFTGSYSGTLSAGNVSAGSFGSNTGGGNYTFPNDLTVDTNTLFVDASTDRVGIGTNSPGAKLDINGNVRASTIEDFSGASMPSNNIITPNVNQVIQGPVSGMLWHDLLAFDKAYTTTYEEYDGTWSSATLDKRLFSHKEDQNIEVIDGSIITAARWTWNNVAWSSGSWMVIAHTYTTPGPEKTILIESSSDGSNWTTRHTSTYSSVAQPVWHYVSSYGGDAYLRLTITDNSGASASSVKLSSIRLLSSRWGDQGNGKEYEYPYYWDEDMNIGLGDSTPDYKLDVAGDINLTGTLYQNGSPFQTGYWEQNGSNVYYNSGNVGISTINPGADLQIGDGTSSVELKLSGPDGNTESTKLSFVDQAGTFSLFSDSTANYLRLSSGEVDNILSIYRVNGNVGIGTAGPGYKLEVDGTARINGNFVIGDASGDSLTINSATLALVNSATLNLPNSQISALNIESGLMNFDTSNSRVGIGTTAPSTALEVDGTVTADTFDGTFTGSYSGTLSAANVSAGSFGSNTGGGNYTFPNNVKADQYYTDLTNIETVSGNYDPTKMVYRFNEARGFGYNSADDTIYFAMNERASMVVNNDGRVGINTTTPGSYELYVNGDSYFANGITMNSGTLDLGANDISMTGDIGNINKLTATTIDPIFEIEGEQYATYVSDHLGVATEETGVFTLEKGANSLWVKVINFNEEEKGSDLWLFSKTVDWGDDMEDLVVLLTKSFRGDVWYETNSKNESLTIYAKPLEEKENLRVSYSLTAPRVDHNEHGNIPEKEIESPLKVEKYRK